MSETIFALLFLAASGGIYLWFWFGPVGVRALRKLGGGLEPLDSRFYYTPCAVYDLLEIYGDEGRGVFRRMLLADMVFPLVYVPALWLGANAFAGGIPLLHAGIIVSSVSAGVFDYVENALLLHVLRRYPARRDKVAMLAGGATCLKMLCSWGAVLAAGCALPLALVPVSGV